MRGGRVSRSGDCPRARLGFSGARPLTPTAEAVRNPPQTPRRGPQVLAAAVSALGGQERAGQVQMAEAVADAMDDGEHLLVQAGTGTGKSLAYLVPSLLHDKRVVVATATLALQHQLVERDIPRLVEAVEGHVRRRHQSYAVLKGRSNYACLHRIREGVPDDQGALVDVPEGSMGKKVLELRAWAEEEAEEQGTGERDAAPAPHRPRLAPGQRQPPRVPRRGQVPVRRGVLRRAGPREGAAAPTSSSPTTRCSRSTRSRACR